MEGTKHEKISLVVLGYFIGLLTMFIGTSAAVNKFTDSTPTPAVVRAHESSIAPTTAELVAVTEPVTQSPEVAPEKANDVSETTTHEVSGTKVWYDNDRLFVKAEEHEFVLSVNRESLGATLPNAFANQGTHQSMPITAISEDGRFVYFCEQHDGTKNECAQFVFDTESENIYPVTKNGKHYLSSLDEAKKVTWSGGLLVSNGAKSGTANAPWLLE